MPIDSEATVTDTSQPQNALEPLDRALFSEALHRANSAAVALRDAQAAFAEAAQYQQRINATMARKYALADADLVNPLTGVITRSVAADKK